MASKESFRSDFNLDHSIVYLNSGSLSITPKSVFEAMIRHAKEYERNPTRSLVETWGILWRVQKQLAEFLNARPEDLFLHHNVTEALNEFILGVPLQNGGEILVTDLEYGAIVNICRYRCEKDGFSLRSIALPSEPHEFATLTGDELVNRIERSLRPDTRLLLISQVMTGNGLVLPVEKLARKTRERGIVLVVDGAHAPGAIPLDFSQFDDVDFYGGNLHKWMMGPKGTAFGWVPKRWHDQLKPSHAGWTTYEVPELYRTFGDGHPFAQRFMRASCHQFAPFFAIAELIAFWKTYGFKSIDTRRRALLAAVEKNMEPLGWPVASPPEGPLRGPLLTYELPPELERLGYGLMIELSEKHALQISTPHVKGRFRLRFSPHIYNTEDEVLRAVGILTTIARSKSDPA